MSHLGRRAQSSLEYVIVIGGVVILAAAVYFLLKGFLGGQTTGTTLVFGNDVVFAEALNLGLEPLSLPPLRWYSPSSVFKTEFVLRNENNVSLRARVGLEKNGFSIHGVDLGKFEVWLRGSNGLYVLTGSVDNGTHIKFNSPVLSPGGEIRVVLHYNNSSPYSPVTSFSYSVNESGVVVVDSSVFSEEKTDFAAPVVAGAGVVDHESGVGETVSVTVSVVESSEVSFLELAVSGEFEESGSFVLSTLSSSEDEFGLWSVFRTPSENGSVFVFPFYENGSVLIDFIVPENGTLTLNITAGDEWGNNDSDIVIEVVVWTNGSSVSGGGPVLSAISVVPTSPGESQGVTFSVTASDPDNVSWCNLTVFDGGTFVDNQPMGKSGDVYSFVESGGFDAGNYTASVVCGDTGGETSGVSKTFSVTIAISSLPNWTRLGFDAARTSAPGFGSTVFVSDMDWPKLTGDWIEDSPAVAELDGNFSNGLEIVVPSWDGKLYAWHADGSVVSGWPRPGFFGGSSAAVVDLDDNLGNGLEVVAGDTAGDVYAYHADGSVVSGWPVSTGDEIYYSSPTVADIDGDGGLEVVIGSLDGGVYAWHADGTSVSGWPRFDASDWIASSPGIADLDGNISNGLEVVVGSDDGNVYAYHADGSALSGWPKSTGDYVRSGPSIADIDADGDLEVLVGSDDAYVYAWHHDGSAVSGWPFYADDYAEVSPAVANLDNNLGNGLEVVFTSESGYVYAVHADGTSMSGWPNTAIDAYSGVAIADVDVDGELEVVAGASDGSIHVFNADGSSASGWPKSSPDSVYRSTPAVLDLDGNISNGLEVVIGSYYSVYVFGDFPLTFGPDLSYFGFFPVSPYEAESVTFSLTAVDADGIAWCNLTVFDGGVVIDNQPMSQSVDEFSYIESGGFSLGTFTATVNCSDNTGIVEGVSETFTVTEDLEDWRTFLFDSRHTAAPDFGSTVLVTGSSWPNSVCSPSDSPSVADFDNDPSNGLEVLSSGCNSFFAWHPNGSYVSGWPFTVGVSTYGNPAVADIDGDPDNGLEFLAGYSGGGLYALHANGTVVSGWPKSAGNAVVSSPTVVELDGNPANGPEIVVGSDNYRVFAWHADGTNVLGWPKITSTQFLRASPSVSDIDFDGDFEVVISAEAGYVYVWHHNGVSVAGWPKYKPLATHSSPAVADLDNNLGNGLEIVVSFDDHLVYAWHRNGSNVSGWPKSTTDFMSSSPTLADLDNNPSNGLEVLIGDYSGTVYAWHADGTVVSGWPVYATDDVSASPSVADVDGDTYLEVFVACIDGNIHAWNHDGTVLTNWPQSSGGSVYLSPVLVELDGNTANGLEVIVSSNDNNLVHVWHADGTLFT